MKVDPTAHTSSDEKAATPESVLRAPGSTLGTILQVDPFQCSMRVRDGDPPATPAAHTSEGPTVATSSSCEPVGPGEGLSTTCHPRVQAASAATRPGPRLTVMAAMSMASGIRRKRSRLIDGLLSGP